MRRSDEGTAKFQKEKRKTLISLGRTLGSKINEEFLAFFSLSSFPLKL